MNIWKDLSDSKGSSKSRVERLTFKDRLGAMTNVPRFLRLVYQTSPWLTISNAFLRITLAVLPLAMLYIGKLIIDEIIMLLRSSSTAHVSHILLWKYVAIEFGIVVLLSGLNKVVNLIDTLLGDLFANHSLYKNHVSCGYPRSGSV